MLEFITRNNNMMNMSKKKHASNVVEAMLRFGDASQREKIVQEMLDVSVLFVTPGDCTQYICSSSTFVAQCFYFYLPS
jgi:hypothetical protein